MTDGWSSLLISCQNNNALNFQFQKDLKRGSSKYHDEILSKNYDNPTFLRVSEENFYAPTQVEGLTVLLHLVLDA